MYIHIFFIYYHCNNNNNNNNNNFFYILINLLRKYEMFNLFFFIQLFYIITLITS